MTSENEVHQKMAKRAFRVSFETDSRHDFDWVTRPKMGFKRRQRMQTGLTFIQFPRAPLEPQTKTNFARHKLWQTRCLTFASTAIKEFDWTSKSVS